MRLKLSMLHQEISRVDGRCDLTNSRIDGLVSEIEGDMEESELVHENAYSYSKPHDTYSYSEPERATRSDGSHWTRRAARNSAALNFLRDQINGSN
jgi:hypothetical protein